MGCDFSRSDQRGLISRRIDDRELQKIYDDCLPEEIRQRISVGDWGATVITSLHVSYNVSNPGIFCILEFDCMPKYYGGFVPKEKLANGHNPSHALAVLGSRFALSTEKI